MSIEQLSTNAVAITNNNKIPPNKFVRVNNLATKKIINNEKVINNINNEM